MREPTKAVDTFLRKAAQYKDKQFVLPAEPPGIRYPIDFYDSMAPFVEITFRGKSNLLTVGNNSNPSSNNTSIIKSFQYSAKTTRQGCTVEVEIHDIEGGNFALWFERINKKFGDQTPSRDYTMECRFGWVGHSCEGEKSEYLRTQARKCDCKYAASDPQRLVSEKLFFLPKILHASYEGGKIKFKIEGIDLIQNISETQESKTYDKMTLKCAVIQLMKEHKITKVEWKKKQKDGNCVEVGFMQGAAGATTPSTAGRRCSNLDAGEGMVQAYPTLGNDALKSALEWHKGVVSKPDKKAFIPGWNPCSREPHLIFWEDDTPKCDCKYEPGKSLGTFLVNAGKCSPVIQFNPKTKWAFSGEGSTKGGQTGSVTTTQPVSGEDGPEGQNKTKDNRCEKFEGAKGNQKDDGVTSGQTTNVNNEGQPEQIMSAQAAQDRANKAFYPIEAQLRIQGDPSFVSPILMINRFLGIVVVNPMHYLSKQGDTEGCGDWLVTSPPINQVYSNKGWIIQGVTHQIKEGQFNTLIDVKLPSPGFELDAGIPYGCEGSGGGVL
tara:strand:- start:1024 stop:2670 length:1647 start_codon:yes stop_codon:yes gene_type:complete